MSPDSRLLARSSAPAPYSGWSLPPAAARALMASSGQLGSRVYHRHHCLCFISSQDVVTPSGQSGRGQGLACSPALGGHLRTNRWNPSPKPGKYPLEPLPSPQPVLRPCPAPSPPLSFLHAAGTLPLNTACALSAALEADCPPSGVKQQRVAKHLLQTGCWHRARLHPLAGLPTWVSVSLGPRHWSVSQAVRAAALARECPGSISPLGLPLKVRTLLW